MKLRQISKDTYVHAKQGIEVENLLLGTYEMKYDSFNKFYFIEKRDDFKLPKDLIQLNQYWGTYMLKTFNMYKRNLGILLHGKKGTGKSIDAKRICIESKLPVITISSGFSGIKFEEFLAGFNQPFILFIDEFDKKYSQTKDDLTNPNSLLSLLDGKYNSNILFLITSNSSNVGTYLNNRPGRIRYKIPYRGLESKKIKEIAIEYLQNKDYLENLLFTCEILGFISIDILLTLIQECNLSGEEPIKLINILNIEVSSSNLWDFKVLYKNNTIYTSETCIHPFIHNEKEWYCQLEDDKMKELGIPSELDDAHYTTFRDIKNVIKTDDSYTFKEGDMTFKFTKAKPQKSLFV